MEEVCPRHVQKQEYRPVHLSKDDTLYQRMKIEEMRHLFSTIGRVVKKKILKSETLI